MSQSVERAFLLLGGLAALFGLSYSAVFLAPVNDEFGHFFAGLCYWQAGDTTTFNVNPPLLRSLASLPGFCAGIRVEPPAEAFNRPEFALGRSLFLRDPLYFQFYLTLGRFVVLCTTLFGAALLYRWAKRLAGAAAGIVAAGLWLVQPQILSHGVLITGDVFCAVAMLLAARGLVWALDGLNARRAAALGLFIALAILAKFTALVLLPIVALAFAWNANRYCLKSLTRSLAIVGVSTLFTLALPYGFSQWGRPLPDYQFHSFCFLRIQGDVAELVRSVGLSPTSVLRVPLPKQLLLGLDRQQCDFENGLLSYAAGRRGQSGWWWFYLYSMLVKLPLGTWLAILATLWLLLRFALSPDRKERLQGIGVPMTVFVAILTVTAIKSGFAQQHRYILVAYPFLFLVIGVIAARALTHRSLAKSQLAGKLVIAGLMTTLSTSSVTYDRWLSSFNLIAGGNRSGYKCLFNDASDWGQDSYRVCEWVKTHDGKEPIYMLSTFSGHAELRSLGAEFYDYDLRLEDIPRPCLLVISKSNYVIVDNLASQLDEYEPVDWIAGTHIVFRFQ